MNDLATYLSRQAQADPRAEVVAAVVVSWSATSNRLSHYGNQLEDVSYLAGLSFVPGDVVLLVKLRTSYVAIGKITTPTGV